MTEGLALALAMCRINAIEWQVSSRDTVLRLARSFVVLVVISHVRTFIQSTNNEQQLYLRGFIVLFDSLIVTASHTRR